MSPPPDDPTPPDEPEPGPTKDPDPPPMPALPVADFIAALDRIATGTTAPLSQLGAVRDYVLATYPLTTSL